MKNNTKTVTEILPCHLTDEERLIKADELASAVQRVDSASEEKKYLVQQLSAKVREAESTRDKLANIVASGSEYRSVTVKRTFDYVSGTLLEVRTDTGEIITRRDLTDTERQLSIPEANDDDGMVIEDARPVDHSGLEATELDYQDPELASGTATYTSSKSVPVDNKTPKASSIFPLRNRRQKKKKAAESDDKPTTD